MHYFFFAEKYRLDFTEKRNNSFQDLFSSQKAEILGNGVDADMKALSIQGNGSVTFKTRDDDCINDPLVCGSGFAVSFWVRHGGMPFYIHQNLHLFALIIYS